MSVIEEQTLELVEDVVTILLLQDQKLPIRGCHDWPYYSRLRSITIPQSSYTSCPCIAINF